MSDKAPAVYLVGPDTYDTVNAISRAFERSGWKPTSRHYRFIRSRIQQWLWKLAPKLRWNTPLGLRPWLEAHWYNNYFRRMVLPELLTSPPDLLVCLRPYRLDSTTREQLIALGCPIVTWATDSLTRYGRHAGVWGMATRNYVFDGGDEVPGKTVWLPIGFDEELFQPQETCEWDLLFVGRIFARLYDQRLRFFQMLAASSLPSTYRVALAGSAVRHHQDLIRRFQAGGGTYLGEMTMPQLARAIARARIAICIHQDDGRQPVNPMFFAIPGCRSCLVTDHREYLGRWLKPEEEYVPVRLEDFLHRVQKLLDDEAARGQLAERGFRAARLHTWFQRIQTMLREVQPC